MVKLTRIDPRRLDLPEQVVERRVSERAVVEMPVRVQVGTVEEAFTGHTVNISKTGMFIATKHPPPLGTVLDVELLSKDGQLLLHARAVVMRHQSEGVAGVGVRFESISYESQVLIERLVEDKK